LALRFLNDHSPARRYIADASYWIYLVHLPLIVSLQVAVSQLAWAWPLKFALILGVAFPVMLVTYQLFVRRTFIGAILNGRRAPAPNRVAASPVAAQGA
jgi:peptidoglycan/LPS O-acetylase OafA/YrhL